MKIVELTKNNYSQYDDFLLSMDDSLFYYSSKYKELLEDYLNVSSKYLLAVDDKSKICGILPLMKKEGKYGIVINSLPFYGSNGGILAINSEAFDKLASYYNNICTSFDSCIYITNPLRKDNSLESIDYDIIDKRVGQWTFIGFSEDINNNLMRSFHSKTRNMVRKAIKENVEVKVDNSQIDFLYETHYDNMLEAGGKPKKKRFFQLLNRYFEPTKDYNIYVAKINGNIIAAMLIFYYNNTVEYFTPATVSKYRKYQPTSLIIYHAMISAAKKGYKWWNWGGTWHTLEGVYKFKQKFGAIDKEYNFLIKVNNNNIFKASKNELLDSYGDFYVVPFDKLVEA